MFTRTYIETVPGPGRLDRRGAFARTWRWLRSLALPPVRESFLRQVYFTAMQGSIGILFRGAVVGTIIIAYMIRVLNADVAVTNKILLIFVFREVGPLFAAVLVILRSGSAVTSEIALMGLSGELRTLRRLGIRVSEYLILPRIVGIPFATVALTFYFQCVTLFGGFVLAPLVIETTFAQLVNEFFATVSLWDVGYSVVKSLVFGVIIALTSCWYGLRLESMDITAIPKAVTRAITLSVAYVMIFNALFAYFVFGVLLFGLIRAEI